MPEIEWVTVLGLGFMLGARHALDADHIAAVSTILSRRPDLHLSGFIGLCWGFGHTLMLLLVGIAVILLKLRIPDSVALGFEFAVGAMLVILGGSLAVALYRERWHLHLHDHNGNRHLHLHNHRLSRHHRHDHWLRLSFRPLAVGMAHGLAGSAALTLMVLSTMQTVWEGLLYILVFGLGSIAGMAVLGMLISVPLTMSAWIGKRAQVAVQSIASLASVGLGLLIMVRTGFGYG
jgi:high-affinity nickel permease